MLPRHQFYTNINYANSFGAFRFMNRNRVQTDLEDEGFTKNSSFSDIFYRNKSTLRYKDLKDVTPYIAYEMYFRLNNRRTWENTIFRNRYVCGVIWKVAKRKRLDFYYMYQQQLRRRQPDMIHVIGISFEQTFK